MIPALEPIRELERAKSLRAYGILDTGPEQGFDDLTFLAAQIVGAPIALIGFTDRQRHWIKSRHGLEASEMPREHAFCSHAVLGREPLIVNDATLDERFHDNPLVVGAPHIRFYAGIPLVAVDGSAVGALCVIDHVPRRLSLRQVAALQKLGQQVMTNLELRKLQVPIVNSDSGNATSALREHGDTFDKVVDGISGYAIFLLEASGRIASWNSGAERLKGYKADEIIGQNFAIFYPEQDIADGKPERHLAIAADVGRHEDQGWRIRKDGSRVMLSVVIMAIRDHTGRVQGFVKVTRALSESDYTRADMSLPKLRTRPMTGSYPIRILHLEDSRLDAELIRRHLQTGGLACHVVQADNKDRFEAALAEGEFDVILIDQKIAGYDGQDALRYARQSQPQVPIIIVSGHIGEEAAVECLHLGATDYVLKQRLTRLASAVRRALAEADERHRRLLVEWRLRESETELKHAQAVAKIGSWTMDVERDSLRWSEETCRIYGVPHGIALTHAEFLGRVHPDDREHVGRAWTAALDQARSCESARRSSEDSTSMPSEQSLVILPVAVRLFEIEFRIVRPNGDVRFVKTTAEVMPVSEGESRQIFGVSIDVTERHIMEQQLRDATVAAQLANNAKSQFLANMSHEIRTPLNAVIGLGYLLEQTSLSEDQRQLLSKIAFAGRSLLSVVNNVLDLSKIEAGELALEDEPFDLPELIRNIGQMLSPQAVAKGIEFTVHAESALPATVRGDSARLRQILINLMTNAIKFTQAGRVDLVVFCTEQNNDCVRLRCEVKDTGIGIEPAALSQLFTPFTQADASTTRRFGGTGLGLAIARDLIQLMWGRIGVASDVGVGSTFWIELPLRLAYREDNSTEKGIAQGLRIVVAESTDQVPDGLGTMARALGWSAQLTESGQQVIELLAQTRPALWPDAFVLEMHLKDMDACQLVTRLQGQCSHAEFPPVIVVADAAESYLEHQLTMRAMDVLLLRPVSSSALFNAVNGVVSKHGSGHERLLQSTNFDGSKAQWLSGARVLVVDDSDINQEVAKRILKNQGAIVATCPDGDAAVKYVREHHHDLDVVLMDVQMPILDGNEATARIRAELKLPALPIIGLTAGALVGERQRSLAAGMNDVITKPFHPQSLIRTVRRLVEEARGEPMPMVMISAKPTEPVTDAVLPASVDASVVQQMFGDDLVLFQSLLARVLAEYADLALTVCLSPDDEAAREQLKQRAHKLKGSAGIVGAADVVRLAGAIEVALQNARPTEVIEAMLTQLAVALTTLRDEAAPLLARSLALDAESAGKMSAEPDSAVADLDELRTLLEHQNLAALEKFQSLAEVLRHTLEAERFSRVNDAIENLEFALAARLLHEAQSIPSARVAKR